MDKFLDKINKIVPVKWQWILNHEGFRRYFKNTGWMFFGQMFSLFVSFFIGAWLARYLGPENYGVLNYAISFSGIFGFLGFLVADNILSKELIKNTEKSNLLLGTSFVLKVLGGFIAFILTLITAFIFESNSLIKLLILIYSFTFVFPAFNIISVFFYSKVQAKKIVKSQLLTMFISSILKVLVILCGMNIIWVMIVYVLDGVWYIVCLILLYRSNGLKFKKWSFDKNLSKSLLKDSFYVMLSSAALFIYLKVDQVIIGKLLDNSSVGLYAVAVKLSEIWYFIPGIISTSLFPAIINAKEIGEKVYRNRLKFFYFLLGGLSLLIAIPISIFAKPIILFMFGSGYANAASILQIYIWSGVGIFLSTGTNQYMVAEGMLKSIFILNLFGMILNIVLNFILIPLIGLNGSALASLISYCFIPLFVFSFNNFLKKIIK